ncbi:urease accessory protein UreD [Scrofimicrobium sp. R131]|uniref:Urease accessory protein UreD n=1 Tax=Scrofimicrobium appendicitidis TaxID=3079930 RepID=A0AAU7V6Y8_9ACTO
MTSFYGGYRLQPDHFEVPTLPREMTDFMQSGMGLPVGSPGKVGVLELDFAQRGEQGRTELVHHYQKAPLKIVRPHYYDPAQPGMPYLYTVDMGGGVVQGDRLRTDLNFGPGTRAHVTSQSHTKVYEMDNNYATAQVNLTVGEGAYVEYVPDPIILFKGSRYYQRVRAEVDPSATLVMDETIYAGRISRGELHDYDVYASDLELSAPGPTLFACDRARLVPSVRPVDGLGVFGGRAVVHTMYVVTPQVKATELADLLHESATWVVNYYEDESCQFAASTLPGVNPTGSAGAWLRLVTNDTVVSLAAARVLLEEVHQLLLGTELPPAQK